MKRHSLVILIFLSLCLLSAPLMAQDAPIPTQEAISGVLETSATATTNTVISGLFLLVGVLVVSLLALVFIVLRNQSKNGNEQATQILGIISTFRDMAFPRETTEARLKAFKEDVKQTPGFLDDFAAMLIEAGWHVISPEQPIVAQTRTASGLTGATTGYKIVSNDPGTTLTINTSSDVYATTVSGTDITPDLTIAKPAAFDPEKTRLHEPGGDNTVGGAGF